VPWLPDGENFLKIPLFVSRECTNVTDRHTDGHRMTAKAALDAYRQTDSRSYNYLRQKTNKNLHTPSVPACDRRTDGRTDILPRHSLRYA